MWEAGPMRKREPASEPANAPVIQLIRGADLTVGERVLHRVLPACVASAGLHFLLAGGVGLYAWLNPTAEAKAQIQEVSVAVEQRPEAPESDSLTDPTPSLDETAPQTAIDNAIEANKTVETKVTEEGPAGNPDGKLTNPQEGLLTIGAENPNALNPGADVTGIGKAAIGTGDGGLAISNDSFRARGSSTTRDALALSTGGTKESQLAVAKGLAWLAKQQKRDGSWEFDGSNRSDKVAATGLALLPFLAAGQTHKAAKGNDYQATVAAGLTYLLKQQKSTGGFSNGSYSHGIATVAVCEAFGMTSDKSQLLGPAQKAIDYIQKAQGPNGSWGYTLDAPNDQDTSIVGWQVQALHSAKMCKDLRVNQTVLTKAMKFLDSVASGSSKSKYGYNNANSATPTRTAIGLLCRYYLNGWGPNHPGMRDGVDYLMKSHLPEVKSEYDMYYYYYATQVLHFHEGDAWSKEWNPKMRDFLMGQQRKEPNRPELDGSWDADKSPWMGPHCGRMGTTCMALLTLEVYYRHLPLYNRGTGGKSDLEGK
jgi:hypothetical protein